MKFVHRGCRLTAWIAIFAILLAALAPAIVQAFASSQQQSTPWMEICTSTGIAGSSGLAPIRDSGGEQGMMPRHCPFCLNHAGHFALPATPPVLASVIDAGAAFACSFVIIPPPRFACPSPQSRVPPVFS